MFFRIRIPSRKDDPCSDRIAITGSSGEPHRQKMIIGRDIIAKHLGYAQVLQARVLDRAIEEAAVSPPKVDLTLKAVVAALTIPVVLGGGSTLPKGFAERFSKALTTKQLPIELGNVTRARQPLTATARGALIAALYEN